MLGCPQAVTTNPATVAKLLEGAFDNTAPRLHLTALIATILEMDLVRAPRSLARTCSVPLADTPQHRRSATAWMVSKM